MTTRSDEELLVAARAERAAFSEFYVRHAVSVHAWFRQNASRDPGTIDELTAETFAQALASLKRFRSRGEGSGRGWLFGIAKNQQRHFLRRRSVAENARRSLGMHVEEITDPYSALDERLLADQLRPHLAAALESLPSEQRAAIELRVIQEIDYRDIAVRLDCSEQAVRIRVCRGLRKLQGALASGARTSPEGKA
jgi:RNA polymerase sigma factor (sigma-70 family)